MAKKKVAVEPKEEKVAAPEAEELPPKQEQKQGDEGLKRPTLTGKPKPLPKKFEQPGTNNQKTEDIG